MSTENLQKDKKEQISNFETTEQVAIVSVESKEEQKQFAEEMLNQIQEDIDSIPPINTEVEKIENSILLENSTIKNKIKESLNLDNNLAILINENVAALEEAKTKILEIIKTEEFSQLADVTPFVGGAKRITESVYGETLSGRELSDKERLKHGVKGAVDLGLDFTGVGEVQKGAKLAYVGGKIASGIANNPEAVVNLGKKIMDDTEKKESFSGAYIMDPDLFDKIAQIEAINPNDNTFNKERYDKYSQDETNNKHGDYSVTANQNKIKGALEMGDSTEDAFASAEVIYGEGGWNRYVIDSTDGKIKLSRGKDQTSGSPEYQAAIEAKAHELGIQIGL